MDPGNCIPLENSTAIPGADTMCDFKSKFMAVEEEKVDLAEVVHGEFFETARQQMACLFVGAVSDLCAS